MNNIIKRVWVRNRMVNIDYLGGSAFYAEDGGHTFQISGAESDGSAVALSGTVAGVFLRPDNTDVAITGSCTGGVVSVTLPANCYDVPGRFGLTIFLTADDQKTAIYAAVGNVARTSSGAVAPQTTADVVDLINRISAAVATIPQSWTGLMADIAPTYSASAVYPAGAYVYYNGDLYRCTTAITTAETWTPAHWTTANLGTDLRDLKAAVNRNTGAEIIEFERGVQVTTNYETTIDISARVTNANAKCAVIPCSEGDVFTINVVGGSQARAFAFADDSGFIFYVDLSSAVRRDTIVVAPTRAAYLILNNVYNDRMDLPSYKGRIIDERYSTFQNQLTDRMNAYSDRNTYIKTDEYVDTAFVEDNGALRRVYGRGVYSIEFSVVDYQHNLHIDLEADAFTAYQVLWVYAMKNDAVFQSMYVGTTPEKKTLIPETLMHSWYTEGCTKVVVVAYNYEDSTAQTFTMFSKIPFIYVYYLNKNVIETNPSTGTKEITFEYGFQINDNSDPVNPNAVIANATAKYAVVPCTQGDTFCINVFGGNNPIGYVFTDASYNVLYSDLTNAKRIDFIVEAPENAAYLFLNNIHTDVFDEGCFVGKPIRKNVSEVMDVVDAISGMTEIDFMYGYVQPTGTDPIDTTTKLQNVRMKTAITPCSSGDIFTVNVIGGSANGLAYVFVDSEYNKLSSAVVNGQYINKEIVAPEDSAYLILNNTNNDTLDEPSWSGRLLSKRVEKLEEEEKSISEVDYLRVLRVAELPNNKTFDLFVFGGQSNMMGASAIPPTDSAKCSFAYEYKYNPKRLGESTGQFVQSKHSAGEWSYKNPSTAYAQGNVDEQGRSKTTNYWDNTYFVSAMSNKIGEEEVTPFATYSESTAQIGQSMAPFIAREYASYGYPCVYAHMAKGGVPITYYFESDVKAFFEEKFASMLEDFPVLMPGCTIRSKCFFWCQGEGGGSVATYKENLATLWTWLQSLGFEYFFCVRVGYFGTDSVRNVMRAQEEFCAENENCYIITRAASYMDYPGMDRSFYIKDLGEEYEDCRDSFFGYANDHINEKGNKLIAKRTAYNVNRVLNEGLAPVLEEENVAGI